MAAEGAELAPEVAEMVSETALARIESPVRRTGLSASPPPRRATRATERCTVSC